MKSLMFMLTFLWGKSKDRKSTHTSVYLLSQLSLSVLMEQFRLLSQCLLWRTVTDNY